MIHNIVRGVLLLLLVLMTPGRLLAELPLGQYGDQFGAEPGLWDLTGNYIDANLDADSQVTIVQDDRGRLTGQCSLAGSDQGITVDLNGTLTGTVKTVGGVTRTDITMKFRGTASNGFQSIPVKVTLQITMNLSDDNSQFVGSGKVKVCSRGRCARTVTVPQWVDVPPDVDGTWELVFDIQNVNGSKLAGAGAAVLSNGRVLPLGLKGTYGSRTDTTKLSLKGRPGTVTIQANAVPGALLLQNMTAKIFGQTVKLP